MSFIILGSWAYRLLRDFFLIWLFTCLFILLSWVNFLSQQEHACGFSPVWIITCRFNWTICVNLLSQYEHLCGFSPVWINMCFFNEPSWIKCLSQYKHLYGFSPVWIIMCAFKPLSWQKHLPQSPHLYFFCDTWHLIFCSWFLTDCCRICDDCGRFNCSGSICCNSSSVKESKGLNYSGKCTVQMNVNTVLTYISCLVTELCWQIFPQFLQPGTTGLLIYSRNIIMMAHCTTFYCSAVLGTIYISL